MRLFAVAVLGVLAMPIDSIADSKAEAKAHIERATELHKDRHFAKALDELKTAYALDPKPELLFAMGQLHVSLGQCPQAITYYERYLSTRPDAETAGIAHEAIDTCKTNPQAIEAAAQPPEPEQPQPTAAPPPEAPAAPAPSPVPAAPPPSREGAAPWYSDYIADGLVGAGVVSGIVGLVIYQSALSTRDQADKATGYDAYADLLDQANSKRTTALVLGGAGAALVVGGALHFVLSDRGDTVQVVPTSGGGAVTWTGRF